MRGIEVEENPQANAYRYVGITIYNSSRFVAKVFSQKYSLTFVGNDGIYGVGTESVYQIGQSSKTECFANISREGLTPQATRETQLSPSILTLRILVMYKAHASFRGMLSRELLTKSLQYSICLSLHILSLIHNIYN